MKTFRKKPFRKSFREKASAKKPLRKASAKETFRESFIKAQSAMEYLMTYGWAILIIAVVLAALFQLGVFNPMTFAPKAPPGSCQVFRPNGPGTTSFINLEGVCSGELPQYVAQFNGNGAIQTNYLQNSVTAYTITAWVMVMPTQTGGVVVQDRGSGAGVSLVLGIGNADCWPRPTSGSVYYGVDTNGVCVGLASNNNYINGKWHQIVGTWSAPSGTPANSVQFSIYVDGNITPSTTWTNGGTPPTSPFTGLGGTVIGYHQAWNIYFNGNIANVQIYNTSLSANEIQALYLEGIGGTPINLQHLVAWWPLNGNANDYSGNGNNGQASNVNFVSNWYNGYTPP